MTKALSPLTSRHQARPTSVQPRVLMLYHGLDRPETMLHLALHRHGFTTQACCIPTATFRLSLTEAGIPVHELHCRSRVDLGAIATIRALIKTGGFDIVHAFTSKILANTILATFALKHRPKIVAYRGSMSRINRFNPLSWLTYHNSRIAAINCVSNSIAQNLIECGIPKSRVLAIHKGHDINWYSEIPTADRASLGIPQDGFVVGTVANMRRTKGIDLLLSGFSQLIKVIPNLHLVLVGEIKEQKLLTELASLPDTSRVHVTGFRADALSLMKTFDVFVHPSRIREGLPKSVIEAMAVGIPAIVSNVGGLPEIVRHLEDGLVVPSNDWKALNKAILQLYRDKTLRQRLAFQGTKRISTAFNINDTVEKTVNMYRSLMELD